MKQQADNKNWFWYRLIFAILILGSLIAVYIYHMVSHTWLRNIQYPFSYWLFQWQFFSFFTFQSNFLVGIWFLIAAIGHYRKNLFIYNQNVRLAITCYITLTALTWIFFLLPGMFLTKTPFNFISLASGIIFHLIFPAAMIYHTLKHKEPLNKTIKEHFKSTFWLYWIYPIFYSLFLGIGFLILFSESLPSANSPIPINIIFPYAPFFPDNEVFNDYAVRNITIAIMILLFVIANILIFLVNLFYVVLLTRQKKVVKVNSATT